MNNKLLDVLNLLGQSGVTYRIIDEVQESDQIRIELYKEGKYIDINIIFEFEKERFFVFHGEDEYQLKDLDHLLIISGL